MLTDILKDVRFGVRMFVRNPVFSLVAVLTIAIGIGANVFVLTLVERILLNPLPYPEPDRLVRLIQSYPEQGLNTWGLSPANFASYHAQNQTFESLAAYSTTGTILTQSGDAEYLQAARVSADFFKVFGVSPALGRTFATGEDTPGKNNVAVISRGLWQRRFGSDPSIIGRSLMLSDISTEVVGVMPEGFLFPAPDTEVWIPMALNPQATSPFLLTAVGRLKPGQGGSTATADTTNILRNAAAENPAAIARKSAPPPGAGFKTIVTPLKEAVVGKIEKPLLILQIAVAFVLLIACANVANLMLSRATKRSQEIALRLALGASPGRIVRQLTTESLLLALVGAVAGALLAWWCLWAFSQAYFQGLPRIEEASINFKVLAVTIFITLATGLLFGLAPAVRAYRIGVKQSMSEGQRGTVGTGGRRMNSALVVVQLALSLVLLIGAGLMFKSFQRLMSVDPGFETEKVLTMAMPVSGKKYASPGQAMDFYTRLLEEMRGLPSVNGAAVTSNLPLSGRGALDSLIIEGQETPNGDAPQADIKVISPGYFKTMGMPLQQGRDFTEADADEAPLVAIVNQKLASQYWPNGDAIGKRIRTSDPELYTIVGIAPTVKGQSLSEEALPHIYLPYKQLFFAYGQSRDQRRMFLVVNAPNPNALIGMVRQKVQEIDRDVPIYSVSTMGEVIAKRLDSQRLITFLLTAFSVMALVLAAVGTYGVMSVYVNARASEFAIRLALGAQPRYLLSTVLKRGLGLAVAGIVIGLLCSWAMTQAISSQLFEVSTTDPLTFTLTPLVLLSVAVLACYIPAYRASRTDPADVLRSS
jgi:putative ABC transport system permease protein